MKEYPQMVKGVPFMVVSAVAGAFGMLLLRKGSRVQKTGLAVVLGGALSNLYDRVKRGYVVDYFSVQKKGLDQVVFNLGDLFIFLGSVLFALGETADSLKTPDSKS
jgi:signal peptidase II